jgi:hypothetical protein
MRSKWRHRPLAACCCSSRRTNHLCGKVRVGNDAHNTAEDSHPTTKPDSSNYPCDRAGFMTTWAPIYPRIVFASVDQAVANSWGSQKVLFCLSYRFALLLNNFTPDFAVPALLRPLSPSLSFV